MVRDIESWLKKFDLAKYREVFAEHEITFNDLAELTEDDLKEMGLPIGPRRRALKAIAGLADLDRPGSSSEAEPTEPPAAHQTSPAAERRQLTVLFCDLVGSTDLSARIDPEDLRDIMRRYQDAVAGAVTRYGGHIAKYLGDGVLVYFGWPQAYEDQSERAVHAGLDAVNAVNMLESDDSLHLQARVGIATGQVVVGDLIGERGRDSEAVTGETPNLAARLQGVAAPGEVVVGEVTRTLIGQTFTLDDLGAQDLKGFPSAVRAWRVTGEESIETRFEAAHGAALSRFVGRDAELQLLLQRWGLAKGGEGQVVLISGEPGIGKSRLSQALRDAVSDQPLARVRYQCSPYHTNSALFPTIQHLQHAAGFEAEDDDAQKMDKLEALLRHSGEDSPLDAQLFANLLSLPAETRYGALEMTPALIKQRTLEAIVRRLLQLSDPNPVLFLLEDAHWIDPTSLELVQLMVSLVPEASVLLVITFRPEWAPPFSGYDHLTSLQLNRLGRSQGTEMVKAIAGSHVPQSVIERIVARTDGIPLFVEELTKSLIEGGLDIAEANIPTTLHASLLARLDRLPPGAKEIAQIGAVIGREFQHELLTNVASHLNTQLSTVLNELIQSELVFRTGSPPEAVYTFKHALVQDVAYGSLLREQRQKLHHAIAGSLAEDFPDISESEPELLAHHYTEAGLHQSAIDFWRKAGERALRRSANVEAINHLNKALALLASLPETPERDAHELPLQLAMGPALMAAKGQGNTEARDAYLRARELARALKDTRQHFRALWGSWRSHMMQGEHAGARELGAECLNVAKESEDDTLFLGGLFAFAGSLTLMGDYVSARDHLEKVIVPDNIEEHRAIAFDFGQDPVASMLAYKSWVLWNLGFSERAREQVQDAVALAEAVAHPLTLSQVLNYAAMTDCFCRDWAQAKSRAEINLKLSEERGFPQTYWLAAVLRSRALVAEGADEDTVSEFETAVRERQSIGLKAGVLFEHAFLAEALSAVNRLEDARKVLDGAMCFADEGGEGLYLPELYRLDGLVLLKQASAGSVNAAEERFRSAISIAELQGSLSLQLRSATSLADLLAAHDRTAEAHKLLTPIYARFTEGFEMSDLQAAKKVLNSLA